MSRPVGAAAYIQFNTAVVSGLYRTFDPGTETEFVDTSAAGNGLRTYAPTLRNVAPTMTLIADTDEMGTAATEIITALREGAEGSLVWGPYGTTAGLPKWGITARVAKHNPSLTYDGETEIEIEFINIGSAFLFDGATAVW